MIAMHKSLQHVFGIGLHGGKESASAAAMGFKAYNLARLARLGLKVPEAFVLGTTLCRDYLKDPKQARDAQHDILAEMLHRLEQASQLSFGSARRPLLVSIRSGAPVSMPGMMDTLLNVGLCDATVHGLIRRTGNARLAWDSYRRLIQQFATVVHGAQNAPFDAARDEALQEAGLMETRELDFRQLAGLARRFLLIHEQVTGQVFPQNPFEQVEAAVGAVFVSWNSPRAMAYRELNALSEKLGTAVLVQRMVFGNGGGTSGAGVGFTRNPATGDNQLYVDFLFNSQGEDVVSGRYLAGDAERLRHVLPAVWSELERLRQVLESEFGDAQEFEFTVQDGELFLLQTRHAKRTPWANLRIALAQVREGLLSKDEALRRIGNIDKAQFERVRLAPEAKSQQLAEGVGAGMGVAGGVFALDAEEAQARATKGEAVILVREDASTSDITGLAACVGLLTACGSRTAHAAVVARQMAKPCVVGCGSLQIDRAARCIRFGRQRLAEGSPLWIDGESGAVFSSQPQVLIETAAEELAELARWRAQPTPG